MLKDVVEWIQEQDVGSRIRGVVLSGEVRTAVAAYRYYVQPLVCMRNTTINPERCCRIQVQDVGSRIEGVVLSGEVAHRGGGVFAAGNDVGEAVADPGCGPQRTAGRRQPRQRSACSNAQKPGLQNSPARFH